MPPPHENAPSSPERPLRTGANPVGDETVVLDVRPVEPEFTGPPISRPGRAKLPIADTVAARSDASRAVVTAEQAPTRAGRFLIIDKLGEGGMGVVYSAYDPELDRRVAIKLIRDGHNSRNAVTRLQREAQAMAKLSHPNVVGVHEVGRVGDGLFVAMDLISGSTLLEWLYAESRTWREIVNMFLQAGHGLAAAHEAGLVHRDFKPSNVLVDARGRALVTDFGLARAAPASVDAPPETTPRAPSPALTRPLLSRELTRVGALMGTPQYMAPEQFVGNQADARSDQFAFCVALWESLYREHPFSEGTVQELVDAVVAGALREPRRSANVPSRVRVALTRGLSPDPEGRFPSMAALLDQLSRSPLQVRRRWVYLGLAVTAIALAGGLLYSARADEARACVEAGRELTAVWNEARAASVHEALQGTDLSYADATWRRVRPRLDEYAARWSTLRTEACLAHLERRESAALFDRRMLCLQRGRAGFSELIDVLASGDASVVGKAVDAAGVLDELARCESAELLMAQVEPPADEATAREIAGHRAAIARARVLELTGRYDIGLELTRTALERARALEYRPLIAEARMREGSLLMESGQHEAAEVALSDALWVALSAKTDAIAAEAAIKRMFLVGTRLGRFEEALHDARYARALVGRLQRPAELRALLLNNLGSLYYAQGDHERALVELNAALQTAETALRADHPVHVAILNTLGVVYTGLGRSLEATAVLERARDQAAELYGEQHPYYGFIVANLGELALGRGALDEARAAYHSARGITERALGRDSEFMVPILQGLGEVELSRGRPIEARPHLERALALAEQRAALPQEHARLQLLLARALVGDDPERPRDEAVSARAASLARASVAGFAAAGERFADDQLAARRWLTRIESNMTEASDSVTQGPRADGGRAD